MSHEERDSVSHWIAGLREGDSFAAQKLWNRYFQELVQLSQLRLKNCSREASGEDIALCTLNSVMVGVRNGRYPSLVDRESLWPLLVTIAARKSASQLRRQYAKKRSQGKDVPLEELEFFIGHSPTPELAIEVIDVLDALNAKHDDPMLKKIILRKLEGFSHQEIAAKLNCSARTVIRKLKLVRQEWEEVELSDPKLTAKDSTT